MKLGLENIRNLLAALDDPQKNYLKVQVAGTNGKGSVCAFLDSICRSAGIKTGLYTSPHLVSMTERVRIDGVDIAESDFARLATLVRDTCERLVETGDLETVPTYFEQVTAIGLKSFAEAGVELAILETGLGGRLDATTAANAEIAAITRIDIDHQEYLGDTIEQIAAEKAAIIRADSSVCIGRQSPEAFAVLAKRCADVGVVPKTLQHSIWNKGRDSSDDFIDIDGWSGEEFFLGLPGEHQIENAALAVLISNALKLRLPITDSNIRDGLRHARHPGRLQWIDRLGTRFLLDGAHNAGGAAALVRYIESEYPDANVVLVYATMKDKDFDSILQILLPVAADIVLTEPQNTRAAPAADVARSDVLRLSGKSVSVTPNLADALDAAVEIAGTYRGPKTAFVLVTGSLYLVGDALRIINKGDDL